MVAPGNIASRKSIHAVFAGGGVGPSIPEQKGGGKWGMLFARTAMDGHLRRREGERALQGMVWKVGNHEALEAAGLPGAGCGTMPEVNNSQRKAESSRATAIMILLYRN